MLTIDYENIINCLASKGVIHILLHLTKKGQDNCSNLDKNIPSTGKYAINTAVLCLVLNGLVEERREQAHNQRILFLTPLGKRIGDHLSKISKIISEEPL